MFKIEFLNALEIVENEKVLKKVFDDLINMLKSKYYIKNDIPELNVDYLKTHGVDSFCILFERHDGTTKDEHIYITRILPICEKNYEDKVKRFLQDADSSI